MVIPRWRPTGLNAQLATIEAGECAFEPRKWWPVPASPAALPDRSGFLGAGLGGGAARP